MDAQRSAKFTKFQGFLKAKKWTSISKFLHETPTGMPIETSSSSSSSISTTTSGAAIAHALEFARGVIDAMVGVIDAGAGSAHSAREAGIVCAKLLDAGAVSFATGVLRAFCADPRIVGRVATLLRLLCQADGARDVIGEEGAVAVLATMWMQHTNCVPLIEALVTLTPSHIDNIWRAMQCGAIATAMHIMESITITTTMGQDDDVDDSSVMSSVVGQHRRRMRNNNNNHSRAVPFLSSSEEKVIDMTTRFIAMCCIYAPDESPAVTKKVRPVRKVEIQYLVPRLFTVLQTAVAQGSRSIVANVISALANISECHIKEGYGYALGGVDAGDMVNLLLQAWTKFQHDEQLMLVAVWALTAYATVRDEAMQALRSNCSVEVHALTKPWKGFVTVDYLCERIGPVRPKFSRFNRGAAGPRTRSKQQTDAAAVEEEEEERNMIALQQQVEMELDENITDPEISSQTPQHDDDIEDIDDTHFGQQQHDGTELQENEQNTFRRITRSASQDVDESEADEGEVESEAVEDGAQGEAADDVDSGVQNAFKRITRSTASQDLSEAEDEGEAEEDNADGADGDEHELQIEEETATQTHRVVSTRSTRSSAHAGSLEDEVEEEEVRDDEEHEEHGEILLGEAHWHHDTNNQVMNTSKQTAATESEQPASTKRGRKRATRARASSARKQLPCRGRGRPKGSANAKKETAPAPPVATDVIVISDEDEQYLVVSPPQTNAAEDNHDHDYSEMEPAAAAAGKTRRRRQHQAGEWDNESDGSEYHDDSQLTSECGEEEDANDDDGGNEETLGKRRSARLRHTPKNVPTDFHLGMYGRQGFVATARAVRRATRIDRKMITRSAPRLSRRRGERDDVDEQTGDEVECHDNDNDDNSIDDDCSPRPVSWAHRGRGKGNRMDQHHGRRQQRRSATKTINAELPLLALLEDDDTRTSFDEGAGDSDDSAMNDGVANSPTPASSADGERMKYRSMRRLSDMMAGLANLDEHALRAYGHKEQQGGGGIKRKLRWDGDNEDVMMTLRRPVKQARR